MFGDVKNTVILLWEICIDKFVFAYMYRFWMRKERITGNKNLFLVKKTFKEIYLMGIFQIFQILILYLHC